MQTVDGFVTDAGSVKSPVVGEGLVVIGSDIFDVDIELSLDVSNVIHQIYTDASARAVRVAVSIKNMPSVTVVMY